MTLKTEETFLKFASLKVTYLYSKMVKIEFKIDII
jgi:hypothetical protein